MPPLSAYTPFESLLFFQCLASLNAQPTNFAAISDTLRKNQFIKEDDAFDTNRLSPQALEELYTTLLQEGFDESSAVGDKNIRIQDGGSTNPKKRKITSGTVGSSGASQSHIAVVPELVSRLYARYKDRVTKEIRDEEKKYREISEEIERLQKDAVQEATVSALQEKKAPGDLQPPSEKMDLDAKEDTKMAGNAPSAILKVPERGVVDIQARPTHQATKPNLTTTIPPRPDHTLKIPDAIKQPVLSPTVPALREEKTKQPQVPQISKQTPSPSQIQPPVASISALKSPINGKGIQLASQSPTISQPSSNIQVKVPPPPQQQRMSSQAVPRPATTTNRNQSTLPPGSTIVFQAQQGPNVPGTPTGQRHAPATLVSVSSPTLSQLPRSQQWSSQPHTGVSPATPQAQQPMMPKQGTFVPQPSSTTKSVSDIFQNSALATPGQLPSAMQTPPVQMYPQKTPSTETPSIFSLKQQRPHRLSMDTVGSLTPWKRTPNLHINIPETPGSPPRPKPEDVSPISETAPSPIESADFLVDATPQKKQGRPETERSRRGRKQSVPPLPNETVVSKTEKSTSITRAKRAGSTASTRNRARSVASRDEESATDSAVAQRKIKHEAPSTPAGVSEDVEMETRVGSRRKAAATTDLNEEVQVKKRTTKRKRGPSEAPEVDVAQQTPSRGVLSQLIYCTRNFPRTGAPIMNDVAAHKHASIFAKPLTEREAPGYKDLIYRPQDLKSIKSALNQGNKAVAAATEAANTTSEGESPIPSTGTPLKNSAWLAKTPELIPPKAIVNSSQLEKELIRMFANAAMFNPAPDRERGFGPSFHMRKPNESRSSSHPWDFDDGGIIRDTREMCDDVEKAVTKWRAAERTTTDESASKSMLSLRGSSGDTNADGTEADNKA